MSQAKERLELADQLYESVADALADADWDEAWANEIRARVEQIRAGLVEGIPADEAFANARARLRWTGCSGRDDQVPRKPS